MVGFWDRKMRCVSAFEWKIAAVLMQEMFDLVQGYF